MLFKEVYREVGLLEVLVTCVGGYERILKDQPSTLGSCEFTGEMEMNLLLIIITNLLFRPENEAPLSIDNLQ